MGSSQFFNFFLDYVIFSLRFAESVSGTQGNEGIESADHL